jgi:serpin B
MIVQRSLESATGYGAPAVQNRPVIAESISRFAYDWFHEVLKNKKRDENTCLSPASAVLAMTMVYICAKGKTKEEMQKALHLPERIDELAQSLLSFSKNLSCDSNVKNAYNIFLQANLELEEEFAYKSEKLFQARPSAVNYLEPEDAAEVINRWVANNTNQRIKNLVDSGMFNEETCITLVNAVCMQAKWAVAFDKELTCSEKFTSAGNNIDVQMMRHVKKSYDNEFKFDYGKNNECEYIVLPYIEGEESLRKLERMIFLPNVEVDVHEFAKKLSHDYVKSCRTNTSLEKVYVTLPKQTLTDSHDLEEALRALGMNTAFNYDAEFKMIVDKSIHITKIVQKNFLKTDEEGSEGTSGTAAIGGCESFCAPTEFRVNRPFIAIDRDAITGAPVFLSLVNVPTWDAETK